MSGIRIFRELTWDKSESEPSTDRHHPVMVNMKQCDLIKFLPSNEAKLKKKVTSFLSVRGLLKLNQTSVEV